MGPSMGTSQRPSLGLRQHEWRTGLCLLVCGPCKGSGWCWVLPLQNFKGDPRLGPSQLLPAGLGMSKRVSLTQQEGSQLCMAGRHPGAYRDLHAPGAFAEPTGLHNWWHFIPDVRVCHSREQASFGICRELHPSEDAVWSRGGHSPCSRH